MNLNKAQKLVRMVELMTRRGGVRAWELMDRFDVDARTLRRYLSDLKEMNLPINDDGAGEDRTIALDAEYRRSGVQLTLPEVLSLHFGRKLFTFLDGTGFAQDLDDAIERLEPAIPRAHAELAQDLDRKFMAVPEHAKDYTEMGDLVDEIITALLYDNPSRASYTKPTGASKDYFLEPLTLATYRQGLYLFARDRHDGQVKSFAVERFSRFSRLRMEKFRPPAAYRPEDQLRGAFGILKGEPQSVSACFDSTVAHYVRERHWHPSQVIEELPDGRVRVRFEVGLTHELVSWLLGFGGDVQVEEPASLARRVRDAHKQALERYT
ncbi:MAG: WYL domain-containing transcriptional regulator [Proteobacteria bacterium]|nr:WYL domain-containing transcriptional regulator [Pseudomonadota bacterium]MCP4920745.1 WYL domain-containing transcriptional regulator [Pseudomonadota bacterium]